MPILKKILLAGFALSGTFIMFSVSRITAVTTIKDRDFIEFNKNYLTVNTNKIDLKDYLRLEKIDDINYMIPSDSNVSVTMPLNDYYQSMNYPVNLNASISSLNMISKEDIIYGEFPKEKNEVVIDKLVFDKMIENPMDTNGGYFLSLNIKKVEQLIGRTISLSLVPYDYKIVGVVDFESPSLYVYNEEFYPIINNSLLMDDSNDLKIVDYNLYKDVIKIKKGRYPTKDYEVMINYDNRYEYELNKTMSTKINGKKLKVVGYYTASQDVYFMLVNSNMVKYNVILNSKNISIYPDDQNSVLETFRESGYSIMDSYSYSRDKYVKSIKDSIKSVVIASLVILLISFVEIYIMTRSSFLSRIKEIGIFRAIGVKKSDIYRIFIGEIFAITTCSALPGLLLMAYILKHITEISFLKTYATVNIFVIAIAIIITYVFNFIVGLIPVYRVIRKRPAEILSRNDLD